MSNNEFLNPYNFISLPKKKAHAYHNDGLELTGRIRYKVTTKSPLFIPNSSTDEAFEQSQKNEGHKSYDFFSYRQLSPYSITDQNPEPQEPVIPGSEMRGVIRSVYETLTDSCMGVLNSETFPVKRSPEQFKPGILKKNEQGYVLMAAKSYRIGEAGENGMPPSNFKGKRNGTRIFFVDQGQKSCVEQYKIAKDKEKPTSVYKKTGYLIKWGMGATKKRYHLFVPGTTIASGLSREDIETRLLGVIESYLEQPTVKNGSENQKAYEDYKNDLLSFLKGKCDPERGFPVTYSILENGKTQIKSGFRGDGQKESNWYLAPAIFTKEISNNSIGALAGEFDPCQGNQECPACALFGHVDKSGIGSRGSRLRFSDLRVEEMKSPEEYYYPITTLPALGGPKLGNVDFYLKKPENATFWTYDYYYQQSEKGIQLFIKPGELRGRKYYWHHPEYCCIKEGDKLPKDEPSILNKTVRPLRNGVSFVGELYFEGISEKELKQLIWILNSEKEKIGYKLGAAKPLGFGSVTCQVLGVTERVIRIENGQLVYRENSELAERYRNLTYEEVGFSKHSKLQFYLIAGLDSVNRKTRITYPKTVEQMQNEDDGEGFRWFAENHTTIDGRGMPRKRMQRKICRALPSLEDENVELPCNVSGKKSMQKNKSKSYQGGRRK